jgi:hypothetical protein
MNAPDAFWRRLVRLADLPAVDPTVPSDAPPWFARRVVATWQAGLAAGRDAVWEQVSRRGLAVALGIMTLSLLVLVRPARPATTWETLASESVMSAVLPP